MIIKLFYGIIMCTNYNLNGEISWREGKKERKRNKTYEDQDGERRMEGERERERGRLRDPCILHTCFAGIFVLNTNPIGVSGLLWWQQIQQIFRFVRKWLNGFYRSEINLAQNETEKRGSALELLMNEVSLQFCAKVWNTKKLCTKMEDYELSPRAEAYTRHEPWSLAPWLTGMIIAVVIFVVLIPAICSAW